MWFKDIRLKFKGLSIRNLIKGNDGVEKRASWMIPISHGYYVVEDRSWEVESTGLHQPDTVVVQREEVGNLEVWLYSLSDSAVGDCITSYIQSHLFGKQLTESQVRSKSKETMKKAYINAKAKLERRISEKSVNVSAASVVVINGEKLVMAQIGGYRAIVCQDGIAHQLRSTHQPKGKRHWLPKVRIKACNFRRESSRKQNDSIELIADTQKVDSDTEFLVLASSGVFQVMRNQEAVDLIRHIDDPQEAAECLTREALTRLSKSNISCIVIRFD